MQNIHEWRQKIKLLAEDGIAEWGLIIIVFLVALASFGLGRLSALESSQAPVAIIQAPTDVKPHGMYMGGLIVASRSGNAYYFPWCVGATKITPGNQIWFQNEDAARHAGYVPGKNCKGLEK